MKIAWCLISAMVARELVSVGNPVVNLGDSLLGREIGLGYPVARHGHVGVVHGAWQEFSGGGQPGRCDNGLAGLQHRMMAVGFIE